MYCYISQYTLIMVKFGMDYDTMLNLALISKGASKVPKFKFWSKWWYWYFVFFTGRNVLIKVEFGMEMYTFGILLAH